MNNTANSSKNLFLKVFFGILVLFYIFYIAFMIFFMPAILNKYDPTKQMDNQLFTLEEKKEEGVLTAPVRTNFLVVGVDGHESLTDTIMIGSFISTNGQINLISIPRDTYVEFSGELSNILRKYTNKSLAHTKINSLSSYAGGKQNGINFLKETIEVTLGIKIDYYVKVNLDAFKSIVDAIGGVYFNVPEGGLKYSDPTQNLYIDLKGGYQLLDGNAAEGLVRFRKGYATQDLKRVEVQQQFVVEVIKQTLKKENLIKNIGTIALNLIKYVDTDFSIFNAPKYLSAISNINENTIKTATLPGFSQTIDNLSYYVIDEQKTKELIDNFFYSKTYYNIDGDLDEKPITLEQ